ncbi:MAG: ABC-2 transporter permease [Sedimentibacter sp.]|uniref:ABC-2 transporter permease n=1 Tax=Sedimentibacter sp. TaxID=1960295 RepID=UPI003158188E
MSDSIKLMNKDINLIFKINKTMLFIFIYAISMSSTILTGDLTISIQIIMSATAYAAYAIVIGLISVEEKTKSSMIFQSMPVKRESIIIGKYLFTTVMILAGSFLSSILPMVKSILEHDSSYVIYSFLNSFMFCTAIFAIFYPLYYKFGYLKIHVVNLVLFYGLIFIPIILNLLKNVELLKPIIAYVLSFVNFLMNNQSSAFAGCVIIYIVSIALSIKFQSNN